MANNSERIVHPIKPLFSSESKVLILGSFPSVKSRENQFFYGHPQNRFWRVIASLFNAEVPKTIEEKKQLILSNDLALWDVIHSCTITGSSDSSIKEVVANDISVILQNSKVERIFCNGATAHKLYCKYILPQNGIESTKLPSTSPANAMFSVDRLIDEWKFIK